jgi:hypothetical protein
VTSVQVSGTLSPTCHRRIGERVHQDAKRPCRCPGCHQVTSSQPAQDGACERLSGGVFGFRPPRGKLAGELRNEVQSSGFGRQCERPEERGLDHTGEV